MDERPAEADDRLVAATNTALAPGSPIIEASSGRFGRIVGEAPDGSGDVDDFIPV